MHQILSLVEDAEMQICRYAEALKSRWLLKDVSWSSMTLLVFLINDAYVLRTR